MSNPIALNKEYNRLKTQVEGFDPQNSLGAHDIGKAQSELSSTLSKMEAMSKSNPQAAIGFIMAKQNIPKLISRCTELLEKVNSSSEASTSAELPASSEVAASEQPGASAPESKVTFYYNPPEGHTLLIRGQGPGMNNWSTSVQPQSLGKGEWEFRLDEDFKDFEYKFILTNSQNDIIWESGENHKMKVGVKEDIQLQFADAAQRPRTVSKVHERIVLRKKENNSARHLVKDRFAVRSEFQKRNALAAQPPALSSVEACAPVPAPAPAGLLTEITVKHPVRLGEHLYIRGEGSGFTWGQIVPLMNIDADTWRLSQPMHGEFKYKILINNQDWESGNDHVATGGEQVEIRPSFASSETAETNASLSRVSFFCEAPAGTALKIRGMGPDMHNWSVAKELRNLGNGMWAWESDQVTEEFRYKITAENDRGEVLWEKGESDRTMKPGQINFIEPKF